MSKSAQAVFSSCKIISVKLNFKERLVRCIRMVTETKKGAYHDLSRRFYLATKIDQAGMETSYPNLVNSNIIRLTRLCSVAALRSKNFCSS